MQQPDPSPAGGVRTQDLGAVLTRTAAAAGGNGADLSNGAFRGIKVVVDVTAISGTTPTYTVTIQGKDQVSGKYFTMLATAAINATGTTVYTVYPGLPATANVSANDVLPKTFRLIDAITGTTPAVTATVGVTLLP